MVYKQAPSDGFRVHPAKPVAVLPWRFALALSPRLQRLIDCLFNAEDEFSILRDHGRHFA